VDVGKLDPAVIVQFNGVALSHYLNTALSAALHIVNIDFELG